MHVLDEPRSRDVGSEVSQRRQAEAQPHARRRTRPSAGRPPSDAQHAQAAHRRRGRRARWVAVVAVAVVLALGAGSAWAYNYYSTSFEWYTKDPSATTFSVRTAGELEALSAIVNGEAPADPDGDGAIDIPGADNFAGKTVVLNGNVNLLGSLRGLEFTPIGKTEDVAFAGTFDGQGFQISGLKITSAGAQNVGLFGVVAETGVLKNVTVASTMSGASEVAATSAKGTAARIGSLAGWCKGSIENCASAASVKVTWDDGNQGSEREQFTVVENVGGLAGACDGNLRGSSFSGALEVKTSANAKLNKEGDSVARVAQNIGGLVGRSGGADWAADNEEVNANPGSIENCTNAGSVTVRTVGQGGTDRFGEIVEAKSENVGGVAGYACGNVSQCTNKGNILATGFDGEGDPFTSWNSGEQTDSYEATSGGGVKVGGIVGSLRSGSAGAANAGNKDAGVAVKQAGLDPYIALSNCSNTGYVSGLNAVGGIVGTAGTFTTITRCVNGDVQADASALVGYVRTTRWNKPNGGGIVGQSLGTVSWSRNHAPVINTKIGYYCGGIAGALFDYEEAGIRVSDMPEIYGCYNTGQVTSWSSGAILGENNGYVHDCVALKDTDPANTLVYATSWAIVDNCAVVFATQAEADAASADQAEAFGGRIALGSGAALSILNTQATNEGFESYYFIPQGANKGYPVLDGENYPRNSYDLSTLSYTVDSDGKAPYTVAYDPIPSATVNVTIDGKDVALYENVDYRVIADSAAEGQGVGDAVYHASIQGIGSYTGTIANCIDYRIVKGNLADCTVIATSTTYNRHAQNNPHIMLLDKGKAQIDPAEYGSMVVNNGADCIEAGSYSVTVSAVENGNYEGSATGSYAISKVNLINCDFIGVIWQNRVWYYDEDRSKPYEVIPVLDGEGNLTRNEDGTPVVQTETVNVVDEETSETTTITRAQAKNTDEAGNTVYGMAVDYTGNNIKPEVIGVYWTYDYIDEATGEAKTTTELLRVSEVVGNAIMADPTCDLQVLYGASATPTSPTQQANRDAGENAGGVTVAYAPNSKRFHNYWVLLFDIVGENYDLDQATVERYGNVAVKNVNDSTTRPIDPALDVTIGDRILSESEYAFEVVKTTAADGTPDEGFDYSSGHKIYYRLVSPTGATKELEEPYEIKYLSQLNLRTARNNIAVTFPDGLSCDNYLNLYDDYKNQVQIVDTRSGNRLKVGLDVNIPSVTMTSNRGFTDKISVAGSPQGVSNRGYTSTLRIGAANYPSLPSIELNNDSYAVMHATGAIAVSTYLWSESNKVPWRDLGYTADDLGKILRLSITYGNTGSSTSILSEVMGFTVSCIENERGETVDVVKDVGKYKLTLGKTTDTVPYNLSVDNLTFEIEVAVPSIASSGEISGEYAFPQWGGSNGVVGSGRRYPYSYLSPKEYAYTGDVVIPTFAIPDVLGQSTLDPEDYRVAANGVDVGTYGYTITAFEERGHLVGSYTLPENFLKSNGYKIAKADINTGSIEIRVEDAEYIGVPVEPEVSFWDVSDPDNPVQLSYKLGKDYTLSYTNNSMIASKDNIDAPEVTITAIGDNMVSGERKATFNIVGVEVDVDSCNFEYSDKLAVGNSPEVVGTRTVGNRVIELTQGESGSFTLVPCVDAAGMQPVADVTSVAVGSILYYRIDGNAAQSFTGSRVLGPVSVVSADDTNSFDKIGQGGNAVTLSVASAAYTGFEVKPMVAVKDGSRVLREDVDYRVSYGGAVNVDDAAALRTITVTGLNGYTGTSSAVFDIVPASLPESCTAQVREQVFAGSRITPGSEAVSVVFNGQALPAEGSWAVKTDGYGANVNVGDDARLTLIGLGNFQGEMEVSFEIVGKPLNAQDFTITVRGISYTGAAVMVDPSSAIVVERSTSLPLDSETDYVITGYEGNVSAGMATINISGKGNYTGNMSGTFNIRAAELTTEAVSLDESSYPLTSDGAKPVPTVKLGEVILPEADYAIGYGANDRVGKGAGTVTVSPSGNGNLVGDPVTVTFDITGDIAAADIEVVEPALNGESDITPPVLKVTYGDDSCELIEGEDYSVETSVSANVGTVVVTVTGIGLYEGSMVVEFPIDRWVVSLAGDTRNETAAKIALASNPQGASGVIVARNTDPADALAASGLAGLTGYPVLLTATDALSSDTVSAITKLGAKEAIIVGGESAVSANVASQLASLVGDDAVVRLAGENRYDTALKIYKYGKTLDEVWANVVVVASGTSYADAVSASPYAAWKGAPVLLADPEGGLPAETMRALSDMTASGNLSVHVVGGSSVVSADALASIGSIEGTTVDRWAGEDRYLTSQAIAAAAVAEGMSYNGVAFASGTNPDFPDALAGGAMQGKASSVMLLVDTGFEVSEVLESQTASISRITYLGGTGAIVQSARDAIETALGWK